MLSKVSVIAAAALTAAVPAACEGNYPGVLFYCDAAYEHGRTRGYDHLCEEIERISDEVYKDLVARNFC
jgi:hypothetical protein